MPLYVAETSIQYGNHAKCEIDEQGVLKEPKAKTTTAEMRTGDARRTESR